MVGAGVTVVAVAALVVAPASVSSASGAAGQRAGSSGSFGWLVPTPTPPGWRRVATTSGTPVLAIPPSFSPIGGDRGSVSAALEDKRGKVLAYLNVTPREGGEDLKGFASFRVHLIGKDEAKDVHMEAAAKDLAFRGGTGSCVMDNYVTRIQGNHYKEIACLVVGKHSSSVVVAAAADTLWARFRPLLRQSVASFRVS
jgi:hypothetical protein